MYIYIYIYCRYLQCVLAHEPLQLFHTHCCKYFFDANISHTSPCKYFTHIAYCNTLQHTATHCNALNISHTLRTRARALANHSFCVYIYIYKYINIYIYIWCVLCHLTRFARLDRGRSKRRGGGLGSRPIFKKIHETYAPS